MSWLSSYTYRRKITLDYTKFPSTLTDFPLLVKLTAANFDFSKILTAGGLDIRFTSDDGSTLLKFDREFHGQITTPDTYGSDFCTGGVASADSVNGGEVAANAFDNNTGTWWTCNTTLPMPHWLKYDLGFGVTKIARKFTLMARTADPSGKPKDFKLQGSNNDSTWDDLHSETGITWADDGPKTYTFANSTAYRYYRLYITDSSGGTYVQVKELEIMEVTVPGTTSDYGYYWVKVPTVSNSVNTDIYLYYGLTGASDGSDKNNVWDSGYKAVYHLGEVGNGTLGEFKDSTVYANDAKGNTAPTRVWDKIAYNQNLVTANNILIPDDADLEIGSSEFVLSFKIKFDSLSGNFGLLQRYTSGSSYCYIAYEGGNIRFRDYGGSIDFSVSPSFSTGVWYDLEFIRTGNDWKVYKNNIQIGSTYTNSAALIGRSEGWSFGGNAEQYDAFNGSLDEIRFSIGTPRSSNYRTSRIASDDNTVNTVGIEELNPIEVIEDLDIDIRTKIEELSDIATDIRARYTEEIKDIDIDIRTKEQAFIDLAIDIRAKLEEHFKDLDLDIRVGKELLEDINTDIRVAEDVFKDIDTDIRVRKTVIIDIETDIRTVLRDFIDISTDIRVSLRISKNQCVVEELYFEEGQYLASQAVTIHLKVYGALKMQFKNEIGGTWSALENYASTKAWTLAAGNGAKQVYARFTDIQNVLSDGNDVIEAVLNDATPTSVTIEAYTDSGALTSIPDSTYQTDKTPFFRWAIPIFNIPYSGFSYSLDGILLDIGNISTPDIVRNGMIASKKAPASNMIFETSLGYYYFKADLKAYMAQEITLSNGDLVNDRIDVIYVSGTSESLNVSEGIPAIIPLEPGIPEDAIKLATVLVPAGTIKSEDTTLTDARQLYVELNKYLNEPLTLGQHTLKVKGICANGSISGISTFNIWVADDSPTIGEVRCYTDATKIIELASGLYQTSDNTPYFEWTSAPAEPGPIRYYYTEDGTEPDIGDSFLVVNNYTPGVYSSGITTLKIKAYDVTTGYWGETKYFIFIYGTQTFTDDIAIICGSTILKQSLKEIHLKEVSWDFNSARVCRFFQPVAFDATLQFSEGATVSVVYGASNTTLFTGRIVQIERTIDIGAEGVNYSCSCPRQDLAEEYAYIIHEDFGETAQITFSDIDLVTAIDTIVSKFPTIVKKVESYPTGANISDEFIGQTVSNVLDSIYAKTKYGWYMKPNGNLVSIDLTATNPGEAKFGIYGTTVNAISPQYNVMAANLQFDVTNRYNKCIIEGAKKQERVTLRGKCIGITKSGEDIVDEGDRADDMLYKVFELDSKWTVVKIIETFISYARLKRFILMPAMVGTTITKFLINFLETEICSENNISRMTREVKYTTQPSSSGTQAEGTPTEATEGTESPGAMEAKLSGFGPQIITIDTEVQGSLGPENTVRFSRAMYNYWPTGESVNSDGIIVTPDVSIYDGVLNYIWRNPPEKRCASLTADVLIETTPLKVEVTVTGTASNISKTLRIVNTSFRYSEDPEDSVDDTARMTQYAQDLLQKYKDIKVNGSITLDTIDLTWDLDRTVNLINTDQGSWSSLNAKVIGIKYDFDANTTTLEITSEYLK